MINLELLDVCHELQITTYRLLIIRLKKKKTIKKKKERTDVTASLKGV